MGHSTTSALRELMRRSATHRSGTRPPLVVETVPPGLPRALQPVPSGVPPCLSPLSSRVPLDVPPPTCGGVPSGVPQPRRYLTAAERSALPAVRPAAFDAARATLIEEVGGTCKAESTSASSRVPGGHAFSVTVKRSGFSWRWIATRSGTQPAREACRVSVKPPSTRLSCHAMSTSSTFAELPPRASARLLAFVVEAHPHPRPRCFMPTPT